MRPAGSLHKCRFARQLPGKADGVEYADEPQLAFFSTLLG